MNARVFLIELQSGFSAQFLVFINVMAIEESSDEDEQVLVPVTSILYPENLKNPDDVLSETVYFPTLKSAQNYINTMVDSVALETVESWINEQ